MKTSSLTRKTGSAWLVQVFGLMLILCGISSPAGAQERVVRKATQAEVNAGTDVSAYVNPFTLLNWIGGGAGGPTNGLNAAQVGAAINATNTARIYPVMLTNGATAYFNIFSVTNQMYVTNGTYVSAWLGNGVYYHSNLVSPNDFTKWNTNGQVQFGTVGGGLANILEAGTHTIFGNLTVSALITNSILTANTALAANANKAIVSIPGGVGVETNDIAGNLGFSTNIPGPWITPGSLPRSAADSTWDWASNYVGYAAGSVAPNAGKYLTFTGGTNAFGAFTITPTNAPSGSGGFPLAADGDANQKSITNLWSIYLRTNISGNNFTFIIRPSQTVSGLPILETVVGGDLSYGGNQSTFFIAQGGASGGEYNGVFIATNAGVFSKMDSNSITVGYGGTGGTNAFGGTTAVTNLTLTATNTIPANTNAAVVWFRITNGSSMFLVPGYQ